MEATEKHFYMYIVRCADGTLYTGYTPDLQRRVKAHNEGKGAKYTKSRRPVVLVYAESFSKKNEAMAREYAVKRMTRSQKLSLIESGEGGEKCIRTTEST